MKIKKKNIIVKNCGKNLTDNIEKTDLIFFLSKFLIIIACILAFITLISSFITKMIMSLSQDNAPSTWKLYIIYVIIFILGYLLKIYASQLYKKNINKA